MELTDILMKEIDWKLVKKIAKENRKILGRKKTCRIRHKVYDAMIAYYIFRDENLPSYFNTNKSALETFQGKKEILNYSNIEETGLEVLELYLKKQELIK